MRDFWNERYGQDAYAYGEAPNRYFSQVLAGIDPGCILLPAEGEGRNAVFAARHGWKVNAFDLSSEGQRKALALAGKHGVHIEYALGTPETAKYAPHSFDALALIYAHFDGKLRSQYHRLLDGYVKVGGLVIMEGFAKRHLAYSASNPKAGGPKNESMLLSKEEIAQDFSNYKIIELEEVDTDLNEGLYHQGMSAVVRFTGVKLR